MGSLLLLVTVTWLLRRPLCSSIPGATVMLGSVSTGLMMETAAIAELLLESESSWSASPEKLRGATLLPLDALVPARTWKVRVALALSGRSSAQVSPAKDPVEGVMLVAVMAFGNVDVRVSWTPVALLGPLLVTETLNTSKASPPARSASVDGS